MSRLLKIVLFAIPSFFFVSVAAASIGALLVVTGSPGTCTDREVSPISAAVVEQLAQRWEQFSNEITISASSIDISESEATSRARQFVADENAPIDNLRVYFCGDGKGQMAGEIEAIGISVDFVVTGHLDVSGPQAVLALDSVDVGNMPGFVSDAVINALLDDDARTLELGENLLGSEIADGLIIISGGP